MDPLAFTALVLSFVPAGRSVATQTVPVFPSPRSGAVSDGVPADGGQADGGQADGAQADGAQAGDADSALAGSEADAARTEPHVSAAEPVVGVLDGALVVRFDHALDTPDGVGDSGADLGESILVLRGRAHGYRFELGLDLSSTSGTTLERVFVERGLDERHRLRFGIVRDPFLFSAFADEDRFVFPYRSRIGRAFERTDAGVELLADYGRTDLRFAFTNGSDGVERSRSGTLRLGFQLLGESLVPGERPRPGADGARLFLAYTDDGAADRADAFAAEIHGQLDRYRAHIEFVDGGPGLDDQRGWAATVAGAFDRGEREIALRAESIRRPTRRSAIGAAFSQSVYRDLLRFQVAAEMVDGPGSGQDGILLSAGAIVTF